jgi:acyl-CoA reductase-like NAD-dependent aldehyde dehydrogenase
VPERAALAGRLRRLIGRQAAWLAEAVGERPGRVPGETLALEVLPLAEACRFLEREAPRLLAPRRLGGRGRPAWLFGMRAEIRRDPLGRILVIAPSNYPLLLAGVQAVQALVAGNAVLVKPAPGCGAPMRALGSLLAQAGLPEGLFLVLPEEAGAATAAIEAGVDKVVLTGSAATGRAVMADLARTLTPSVMELSGNDAVIVLPGADADLVARALAWGVRLNGGATCIAPRRVFVDRHLAGRLEAGIARLLAGAPAVTLPGRVAAQMERLLDEAREAGCRLVGPPPEGGAMAPLLVAGARPGLGLLREDIFAPVLSLVPVESEEEALALAADCDYALGAAVFGPEDRAVEAARRLVAGVVTVNDLVVPTADPRLPFGGRRSSGFGTTRGAEGLLEMTAPKVVCVSRGRFRPHYDPLSEGDAMLLAAYANAAHGRAPGAWRNLLSALLRRVRGTGGGGR